MSLFPACKPPKTALGYHRILSPLAGIRVSPLALGAMSIGSAWSGYMGSMSKDESFALLDAFYEAGGNFIDTANNYQAEESEQWIGEWMTTRKNRDQIVLATKYTTFYKSNNDGMSVNHAGNHTKSLRLSLRDSLAKLNTDYIDILYVHWWDHSTSIEELMRSLDDVVRSGKVLYLGISDCPAWIVAKANTYAKAHALTPFSIYQGKWNVLLRDFERDIIPMCQDQGMALAPWGAMGQGRFQTKKAIEERKAKGEALRGAEQTPAEVEISAALEKVADEVGATVTAVALAYVLERVPYVFPIIGGRKVEHLHDNIKALEISLSQEQIEYLESHSKLDLGFPNNILGDDPHRSGETQNIVLKAAGNLKWVKPTPAIKPKHLQAKKQ